ncbi:auxin-induced protein IAA6-like [Papaver somniferum]|uniref:auxin-induced protein IAA6-like n=1 Tax=Papaver somniferum TaxID=3469 RepID=UPI000E6F558E|nr:auxin-induced protein IAA6-like [Papaver somniferum]
MAAKQGLGFEITELRLGLPGASSPVEIKNKKRVFTDINEDEENNSAITNDLKRIKQSKHAPQVVGWPPVCSYRKKYNNSKPEDNKQGAFSITDADEENSSSTVTEDYSRKVQNNKATSNQVVGWPPVCSYRKKNNNNGSSAVVDNPAAKLNVKISMDGAPYLRKIDLNVYKGYSELAMAFEKLFGCFGMGKDSEYIAIYEDKDGDWMLVGDGPYKMFTQSCKRLRIMKRSEAKGFGLTL